MTLSIWHYISKTNGLWISYSETIGLNNWTFWFCKKDKYIFFIIASYFLFYIWLGINIFISSMRFILLFKILFYVVVIWNNVCPCYPKRNHDFGIHPRLYLTFKDNDLLTVLIFFQCIVIIKINLIIYFIHLFVLFQYSILL